MTTLGTLCLVLAIPCLLAGVAMMMAMAGVLQARGHAVDWINVRLYIFDYIRRYREVTIEESGRSGPLFYMFVVSMNSALVLVIIGLALRLA